MYKKGITWAGFLLRFLAAIVLVFSTYNPEGYSFYHWIKNSLPAIEPLMVFAGIILLIGWTIFLRPRHAPSALSVCCWRWCSSVR